jgi:small basic protein
LIDYLNRAFSIFFSIIKLLIAFIEKSLEIDIFIELIIEFGNAIFRKISSFSSIMVANSSLASFIARVIKKTLEDVYFSAI